MTSMILYINFIPLLAMILLGINLIFAPHNPYQEKSSTFECGFHSFLGQNRTQFSISFFVFALLFLLFDLEILLVYPYVVSSYTNDIYGLIIMLIFFLVLTLGFTFELGKNALKIDSRQIFNIVKKELSFVNKKSGFISLVFAYSFVSWLLVKFIQLLTCNLKTSRYDILKELMYCIALTTLVLATLFLIGLALIWLNVIDLSGLYNNMGPLYMNNPDGAGTAGAAATGVGATAETGADILESYPEYKQVQNLNDIVGQKQFLLGVKQDITDKLWFRTPQIYIDQLKGLNSYASRPNPDASARQVAELEYHFRDARANLDWALGEREKNLRDYAECTRRLQAVATKIAQLGGNPNA